jgi:predicted MFS family arabinose efflux permease
VEALRRNFVFLPIFALLTQEAITNSVYTFYLLDVRGLGMATLAGMHVACDVFGFLADVPTGYLADRLGRRSSLIAGAVAQLAGIVALWVAASVPGILAGFLLIALGDALRSGADQALLYDSHRALGEVTGYRRRYALMSAAALVALAGGELLGGALAHRVSFDHAWAAEAAMCVAGIAVACALVEAPLETVEAATHVTSPPSAAPGARAEVAVLVAFVVMSVVMPSLAVFISPFELKSHGVGNTEALGMLLAGRHILQAAVGALAARGTFAATGATLVALAGAGLAGLLALAACRLAGVGVGPYAACLLLSGIPRGLVMPVASEIVNRRLDPRWRATALSTITMGERLVVVPLLPAMAWMAERGWFAGAYALLAALLGVTLVALGKRVAGLREDDPLTSGAGIVDDPQEDPRRSCERERADRETGSASVAGGASLHVGAAPRQ